MYIKKLLLSFYLRKKRFVIKKKKEFLINSYTFSHEDSEFYIFGRSPDSRAFPCSPSHQLSAKSDIKVNRSSLLQLRGQSRYFTGFPLILLKRKPKILFKELYKINHSTTLKSSSIFSILTLSCLLLTPAISSILLDALLLMVSLYLSDKYTISLIPD